MLKRNNLQQQYHYIFFSVQFSSSHLKCNDKYRYGTIYDLAKSMLTERHTLSALM